MACMCAPALIVARNELNALFPDRDKASDGCCGDAAHAARKSDHNPNIEGYARAYDYDEDISTVMGDQELTGMGLVLLDDKRTKYLIYEAQLLYPDGTVKPYTGINAHRHHLHHSIHDWAVNDKRPWGIARAFTTSQPATPAAPLEEDDVMKLSLVLIEGDPQSRVYLAAPGAYPVHVTRLADYVKAGDFTYVAGRLDVQLEAPPADSKRKITDGEGTSAEVWVARNGRPFGLTDTGERL